MIISAPSKQKEVNILPLSSLKPFDFIYIKEEARPGTSKQSRFLTHRNNFHFTTNSFHPGKPSNNQKLAVFDQQKDELLLQQQKGQNNKSKRNLTSRYVSKQTESFADCDKQISHAQNNNDQLAMSFEKFNVAVNNIQKGDTLDKLFGSGFKQISANNLGLISKNKEDLFPSEAILEADNTKNFRHSYDQFEILEAENEEDLNTQRCGGSTKRQNLNASISELDNLLKCDKIREKINQKYRP